MLKELQQSILFCGVQILQSLTLVDTTFNLLLSLIHYSARIFS